MNTNNVCNKEFCNVSIFSLRVKIKNAMMKMLALPTAIMMKVKIVIVKVKKKMKQMMNQMMIFK